jgi:hypothetical protein
MAFNVLVDVDIKEYFHSSKKETTFIPINSLIGCIYIGTKHGRDCNSRENEQDGTG